MDNRHRFLYQSFHSCIISLEKCARQCCTFNWMNGQKYSADSSTCGNTVAMTGTIRTKRLKRHPSDGRKRTTIHLSWRILRWSDAELFLEALGEIGLVAKSYTVSDLRNCVDLGSNQVGRALQSQVANEFTG